MMSSTRTRRVALGGWQELATASISRFPRSAAHDRPSQLCSSAKIGRESANCTSFQMAKNELLASIAERPQVKEKILSGVKKLEDLGQNLSLPLSSPAGRWSLIYSTQNIIKNEKDLNPTMDLIDSVIQGSTSAIYRIFFQFAPALAGSQGDMSSQTASLLSPRVSNEQIVDLDNCVVDNKVTAKLGPEGPELRINVLGECKTSKLRPENGEGVDTNRLRPPSFPLDVTFTEFTVGIPNRLAPIRIPLPRPRGYLDTTFCYEDLRISRGGRGGIFILKRIKEL